jgi:hypothetical protein
MATKPSTLKTTEAFVREVLTKDLNQRASQATIREIAQKVSRGIPSAATEKRKSR